MLHKRIGLEDNKGTKVLTLMNVRSSLRKILESYDLNGFLVLLAKALELENEKKDGTALDAPRRKTK